MKKEFVAPVTPTTQPLIGELVEVVKQCLELFHTVPMLGGPYHRQRIKAVDVRARKVLTDAKAAGVTPTPPTDPRLEEWMLAVASNHVYKVAAWRGRSAEFMQTQVIRLAESILRYSSEAGAAPKRPQPLALSHCMQELKAYIDNVIAERGRDNALSFLSLTRMESVIREALAAPSSTSGPTEQVGWNEALRVQFEEEAKRFHLSVEKKGDKLGNYVSGTTRIAYIMYQFGFHANWAGGDEVEGGATPQPTKKGKCPTCDGSINSCGHSKQNIYFKNLPDGMCQGTCWTCASGAAPLMEQSPR